MGGWVWGGLRGVWGGNGGWVGRVGWVGWGGYGGYEKGLDLHGLVSVAPFAGDLTRRGETILMVVTCTGCKGNYVLQT